MNNTSIIDSEFAQELQKYDLFFRFFWELGGIKFLSDEEAMADMGELTAAIGFTEDGDALDFVFAESYWDSLNDQSRRFVICHEMLHVLFRHGLRFKEFLGKPEFQLVNYAADVVINELLVSQFGFVRSELDDRIKNEGCWYNTVFPEQDVEYDRSTDYYFELLKRDKPPAGLSLVDCHSVMANEGEGSGGEQDGIMGTLIDSNVLENIDSDLVDKLKDGMNQGELESLIQAAGSEALGAKYKVQVKKKKKKKWESVIKKWEHKTKKDSEKEEERWDIMARRFADIMSHNRDFYLPSETTMDSRYMDENKITVFFFLDTSGSCISYKQRFFNAANSLDKKRFDVRLFCFDTSVYETTLESGRVRGGGGTSFRIIENKIQQVIKKERLSYPKAVWVISDGFGDKVNPQHPERWYWFMTNGGNTNSYIPKISKTFNLKHFE